MPILALAVVQESKETGDDVLLMMKLEVKDDNQRLGIFSSTRSDRVGEGKLLPSVPESQLQQNGFKAAWPVLPHPSISPSSRAIAAGLSQLPYDAMRCNLSSTSGFWLVRRANIARREEGQTLICAAAVCPELSDVYPLSKVGLHGRVRILGRRESTASGERLGQQGQSSVQLGESADGFCC